MLIIIIIYINHMLVYKLVNHVLIYKSGSYYLDKYVTGFAKRGLIHTSDFATLMRHNFICSLAMRLKFTVSLV